MWRASPAWSVPTMQAKPLQRLNFWNVFTKHLKIQAPAWSAPTMQALEAQRHCVFFENIVFYFL
jgi:hypothetical protein